MRPLLTIMALSAVLIGCTVTPNQIKPAVASFDGADQNSGIIGITTNGTIQVTAHFRDRYNGLVLLYGQNFVPPVAIDDGIKLVNGGWQIDKQHFVYFESMNRWRKENLPANMKSNPAIK